MICGGFVLLVYLFIAAEKTGEEIAYGGEEALYAFAYLAYGLAYFSGVIDRFGYAYKLILQLVRIQLFKAAAKGHELVLLRIVKGNVIGFAKLIYFGLNFFVGHGLGLVKYLFKPVYKLRSLLAAYVFGQIPRGYQLFNADCLGDLIKA